MNLQLPQLFSEIDAIHQKYGDDSLCMVYGTGKIRNPKILFLFMSPTARNLTTHKDWKGIRAPWVGISTTWNLMSKLGIIKQETFEKVKKLKKEEWSEELVLSLYEEVAKSGAYLTNLGRCTQLDARPVRDSVFRESREVTLKEIELVNPKIIIAFGNQVASNLLQQKITVASCCMQKFDLIINKKKFAVYPTYYPVGMGQRNMPKAVEDILSIVKSNKLK
jgi:uracil-DNA glycosylase